MTKIKGAGIISSIYLALIIIAILYIPVLSGFFQHDEWPTFARLLSDGLTPIQRFMSFFRPNVAHFTPLHDLSFYFLFLAFGLNFTMYGVVSILLHLITVYLVYLTLLRLIADRNLSIMTAFLFGINGSSYQATSWVGTTVNTHGAVIFGIVSLLFFLKATNDEPKKRKVNLVISFGSFFVSLLFKEIALGLLPIYIASMFLLPNGLKSAGKRKISIWLILLGLVYLIFRVSMSGASRGVVEERLVTETQSLSEIAINTATFPAKIFSQALIPTGFLLSLAKQVSFILPDKITGLLGTTEFDVFSQQVALQTINWVIFIGAIIAVFAISKSKERKLINVASFGLLFSIFNSFIYAISPGRAGSVPVVDSRNIYFPAVGASIFLVALFAVLIKKFGKKIYLVILAFALVNIFGLTRELSNLASQGTERRAILEQIKTSHPKLPDKVVFFTQSDKSFYGLPENERIMPFEINFGYTLMVWYLPTQNYDKEFVKLGGYLYNLTDEGYKEVGGKGFGYFRDFDNLEKAVDANRLPQESIIAFEYNSIRSQLVDISGEIRQKIGY